MLTASFVPDDLKKRTIKNMNKHPEFLLPLHWEINDPARKKRVSKMIKKFYFGKERISNLTLDNLVNVGLVNLGQSNIVAETTG